MSERTKSCAERIAGELAGRLEDFDRIMGAIDSGEPDAEFVNEYGDDPWDAHGAYALSVEPVRQVRVVLSTGGQHDEFVVSTNDGGIVGIEYVYQDWFDGARRELNGDEFDRAARFLEPYVELIDGA